MTDHKAIERLEICERCGDCLTCAEHDEAIELAISALKERENRAMDWISVKERLPEDERSVLAYYGFDHGDGNLNVRFIGTSSYFCFDPNPHWQHADRNLVVTHWMPLPEPQKEEA